MTSVKEVISIPELSRQSGVTEYSIRKLIKDGRLPVLKMGNKWFVEVEAFRSLFLKEGDVHV